MYGGTRHPGQGECQAVRVDRHFQIGVAQVFVLNRQVLNGAHPRYGGLLKGTGNIAPHTQDGIQPPPGFALEVVREPEVMHVEVSGNSLVPGQVRPGAEFQPVQHGIDRQVAPFVQKPFDFRFAEEDIAIGQAAEPATQPHVRPPERAQQVEIQVARTSEICEVQRRGQLSDVMHVDRTGQLDVPVRTELSLGVNLE